MVRGVEGPRVVLVSLSAYVEHDRPGAIFLSQCSSQVTKVKCTKEAREHEIARIATDLYRHWLFFVRIKPSAAPNLSGTQWRNVPGKFWADSIQQANMQNFNISEQDVDDYIVAHPETFPPNIPYGPSPELIEEGRRVMTLASICVEAYIKYAPAAFHPFSRFDRSVSSLSRGNLAKKGPNPNWLEGVSSDFWKARSSLMTSRNLTPQNVSQFIQHYRDIFQVPAATSRDIVMDQLMQRIIKEHYRPD